MPAIRFPEGTTFRQQYTIKDQTRAAISLVGAQMTFAVYEPGTGVDGPQVPWLEKTVGNGLVVVNGAGGIMRIDFEPADTVDRGGPAGNSYPWELELIENNGDTWLAGAGLLVIVPSRRLDA